MEGWQFQGPVYYGVNYDIYPWAYYILFFSTTFSSWMSSILSPNGCLLWSSLISFLSNEYKILGMSYNEIFEGDQTIQEMEYKLRKNVSHHARLNL